MQFPRVFSVLSFLFAFAFFLTSATPIESDKAVAKRQEAQILTILTTLHVGAVAKATEISARCLSLVSQLLTVTSQRRSLPPVLLTRTSMRATAAADPLAQRLSLSVTPLFNELIGQFNDATTQLAALPPSQKRQSPTDIATLTATILTVSPNFDEHPGEC